MKHTWTWVSPLGHPEKKVWATAKPRLPRNRKISIACFAGAIALSIYGIAENFFKAGVEGQDFAELNALKKIGNLGVDGDDINVPKEYEGDNLDGNK